MENIEIKARIKDLTRIRKKVQLLDYKHLGSDQQVDTYFYTKAGRFKLRESKLSGAYLVMYFREDNQGPKSSTYQIIPLQEYSEIKTLLSKMLGKQVVVEKERDIFLYENVRIHLDRVVGLGEFLELEAVMDHNNNNRDKETEKVHYLLTVLGIGPEALLAKSYRELKLEQ